MGLREEIEAGELAKIKKRLVKLNLERNVPGLYVTPLMQALRVGQLAVAEMFYDAGADPGEPLAICAGDPNLTGLVWLLDAGADIDAAPGALRRASAFKNPEVVELLLDRGANANATNADGDTALHEAAYQGSLECARLLLDRGARTDVVGLDDMTASLAAASSHGEPVLALLAERGLLVVADRDHCGWTPLHHAAAANRERSVVSLLEAGADDDARTTRRRADRDFGYHWPAKSAPLHTAASTGAVRAITVLLDAGAEITARDGDDNTALHLAALAADAETMQALIDGGTDVTLRNRWGWTPLHFAALSHKPEGARTLLAVGDERTLRAARTTKSWKAYGSRSYAANATPAEVAAIAGKPFV